MDLSKFDGPWWVLIQRYRSGQPLEKRDILNAMASDHPIPDEAKPLLHDVLDGYKFKNGNKKRWADSIIEMSLPSFVDNLEAWISGHDLDGLSEGTLAKVAKFREDAKRAGETPRTIAKREVADIYAISERTLEKYITASKRGR